MSSRDLSVLKKVISKLNGLTLETAIEVIDRAIAAEAKLAEIEKQEPIYMWQLEDEEGWIECTKEWFYGDMSNGYEKRIVYASPVQQFKQSCAECGAGADDEGLCLYCVKCMFSAQQSPAVAVPAFLLEMSEQMREQDSRSTSHPFWQVRCKRYIVTEQGYNEHHWEICGDDGVIYSSLDPIEELHKYLIENYFEFVSHWNNENHVENLNEWFEPTDDHLPDGLRLVYVQETEEIVTTHLTESDAMAFIARKQHDYPKLYTYVESAYWSPQIRQLQDWIISLSAHTPPSAKEK